ncbi:phospholipid scramblase-related protein [Thermocrispum municipale]|uniref:phospholipid scramblase-related protein n=1 Tax=Thermocrispum municipale TaxID=37926 RepID=UPI0005BBF805|nr:phospholipid scramblase-related protein [Thermocrispum municipale]
MTSPAPGWYQDPGNPQVLRWWDGSTWTQHTQPNPHAQPAQQPPPAPQQQAPQPRQYPPQQAPQQQQSAPQQAPQQQYAPQQAPQQQYAPQQAPQQYAAAQQGFAPQPQQGFAPQPQQGFAPQPAQQGFQGGPTVQHPLYTAPELLIAQKVKVFGVSSNAGAYQIFDTSNTQIGVFKEADGLGRKALDMMNPLSGLRAKEFALTDAQDAVVLKVRHPQGLGAALKPKFEVLNPQDQVIGMVERKKVFAKLGFVFTVNGTEIGHFEHVKGMRSSASMRFVCRDANRNQVGEIVKRGVGQKSFKEVFTQDDSYVLLRPNPIPEPLGSLVLISACALDQVFFERD